jgi:hypothetical protein
MGRHGVTVCYADRFIPKREQGSATSPHLNDAENQEAAIPFLRRYTVFNVSRGRLFECGYASQRWLTFRPEHCFVHAPGLPEREIVPLGDVGAERFVYSPFAGRWRTPIEIGTRVYKDLVLGHLSDVPVAAPRDGILRGIVRDGSEIAAGVKLVEIDPRGRHAQWTGIDERGRAIAIATLAAARRHMARGATSSQKAHSE